MPLDTQTFKMTKYWLYVALDKIPFESEIFSSSNLSMARKEFLAGNNMLTGIKNWLSCANLIDVKRGKVELTEVGKQIRKHDPKGEHPWTWWLFHLHLCSNIDAFPYSTFFTYFDSDGRKWMTLDEIVKTLTEKISKEQDKEYQEKSIKTYFEGINAAFRPGSPMYGLGLMQRRYIESERKEGIRRCPVKTADIVVAYAVLLFHKIYFHDHTTVESRSLLEKGVGKSLGLNNNEFRETLTRISQNRKLNNLIQYSTVANIDSVEIKRSDLNAVLKSAYISGEVQWH